MIEKEAGVEEAWAIVPFVNNLGMAIAATQDLLKQDGCRMRVLLIDKSEDPETRVGAERFAATHFPRVLLWSHTPALQSLSATWNQALNFVWSLGHEEAMVCNNDIRLSLHTWQRLKEEQGWRGALLVSAIGVREPQFSGAEAVQNDSKGGPDFSCFLISKRGHEKYPFDEGFEPAFTEDCDWHRRVMLGGDGQRGYSIDVPYLHYASQTLKAMPQEKRERLERQIENISRAHYRRKWGGGVNEERFTRPFEEESASEGVTNQDLYQREREKWSS